MDPKWNPMILMLMGTLLMVFAAIAVYSGWARELFGQVVSMIVLALGALTMASGVVLAYMQMFRRDPFERLGRR